MSPQEPGWCCYNARMETTRNIFLVGLMGAGKTTVGRQLAQRLGKAFHRHRPGDRAPHRRADPAHLRDRGRGRAFARARRRWSDEPDRSSTTSCSRPAAAWCCEPENRERLADARLRDLPAGPSRATSTSAPGTTSRGRCCRPTIRSRGCEELYGVRDPLYREVADLVVDTGRQSVARAGRPAAEATARRMQTVRVALGGARLPDPHRRAGCSTRADLLAPHLPQPRVAIVTNPTVAPLYLERLRGPLRRRRRRERPHRRPRRRGAQGLGDAQPGLRRAARAPLRPQDRDRRARRRRGRRPRRLRRRDLSARRAVHPGADHAARAGGLVGRRQDRDQPSARQEHDRRVLPAARGARRHGHARDAAAARAARRSGRGHQARC